MLEFLIKAQGEAAEAIAALNAGELHCTLCYAF